MQVMLFLEFIASFLEFFSHEATLTEDKSTCAPPPHTHTKYNGLVNSKILSRN